MNKLKGIIQHRDAGHTHTDIVVTRGHGDIYERHRVGTDVKVTRSIIEAKLSELFTGLAGPAKWPHHINAVDMKEAKRGRA